MRAEVMPDECWVSLCFRGSCGAIAPSLSLLLATTVSPEQKEEHNANDREVLDS
jgi:hypothetical protein